MKKDRLQFIKKFNFGRLLARFDSLFIIQGVKGFELAGWLSRPLVRRSSASPEEKIAALLKEEQNPALEVIYREFTGAFQQWMDKLPFPEEREVLGNVCLKSSAGFRDAGFLWDVCRRAAPRYPHLPEGLPYLKKRLDLNGDMRLYASELELLQEHAASFPGSFSFDIDWIKTDRENLMVNLINSVVLTAAPSRQAAANLLSLWFGLFYEKHIFPADLEGVWVNRRQEVCPAAFDGLYPVDSSLQDFLWQHLKQGRQPKNYLEHKLVLALNRLRHLTGEKFFDGFVREHPRPVKAPEVFEEQTLSLYADHGMLLSPSFQMENRGSRKPVGLLNAGQVKKDPQFAKSASRYILLLVLAILGAWLLLG